MSELYRGMILADTYEIIEQIGAGGAGITYRGRHLRLQTDVVIKKIRDEVADKINTRAEADILKNLKHANLPRIYDFIESDDGIYTVIDYIDGDNLHDAVKKHGAYNQKQVMKWAMQLGDALNYLHSQNPPIIHSDIKPANIMIDSSGNICLIDFNISLAMGESMESAVGISPGFSPPEQYGSTDIYYQLLNSAIHGRAAGKKEIAPTEIEEDAPTEIEEDKTVQLGGSADNDDKTELLDMSISVGASSVSERHMGRGIDARSDIYSLGMTLIYLLTGIDPIIDFDRQITLEEAGVDISEGLRDILKRMIQIDPKLRYRDGGAFLHDINNIGKIDRRYKRVHRNQLIIQFIGSVTLIAGLMIFLFGGVLGQILGNQTEYNQLVTSAEEYIAAGDYDNADSAIEKAVGLNPDKVDAYIAKMYMEYSLGNYEECLNIGNNCADSAKIDIEASENSVIASYWSLMGNSSYELNDINMAKKYFEQAIIYGDAPEYYCDLAITYARLGYVEEALEQLDKAVASKDAQDSVYLAQGEIAMAKGDAEGAITFYKQAINTALSSDIKKRATLLCARTYNLLGEGYSEDCISLLEPYVSTMSISESLMLREELVRAYMALAATKPEYNEKALNVYTEIVNSGFGTFRYMQNMAVLYENMKRYSEAEQILNQMLIDYPGRYEVYKCLAYLELYREAEADVVERDYHAFKEYYDKAEELWDGKQDDEMTALVKLYQDIEDSGWAF